jgi:hypothetical protein
MQTHVHTEELHTPIIGPRDMALQLTLCWLSALVDH